LAAAEAHLGKHAPATSQAFVALNTAFLKDVAVVHVPAGRIVETPIHLVFIAQGDEIASHPRVLIVLERGAAATIVESYVGIGEGRTLSNAISEIVLADGAILTHYKLLQEPEETFHIGTTQVHQERDSVFTSFAVAVGSQLARSELNVTLAAPGADCTLNGLYVVEGSQHVDNHTAIEHAQPHGTSRQLYKGVLDGRSRAVFNGKVVVQPGAVATDAQQTNRNLILSDAALVDTKPQLEIRDNDVRCSHGATIGQLDEDQVFYLKSRGMGEHRARSLLTYGFANEVIARMKLEPIRVELDRLLLNRLEPDLEDDELPDAEVGEA
jgi:Fe-S cluster assembly protein SufD